MPSFPPSEHTKLTNLAVLLGLRNQYVSPILLDGGYPLRELGLRIPIPAFDPGASPSPAPTPDVGYSSPQKNAVLFLELKGGGCDDDQFEKYKFIQDHPDTLIGTPNKLRITEENLIIDFGIFCSNLEKISDNHYRNPIPFPVIHYDESRKVLRLTNFTGTSFINSDIGNIFSSPIDVPRLPLVYIPFSQSDYPNNIAYLIQKIMIMIISRAGKLERYERLSALDEIIIQEYPLFKLLGRAEFHELIGIVEKILHRLFPDDSESSMYNINKYREIKNGKVYLKRTTLRKFLEIFQSAAIDYQNYRCIPRQASLFQFDDSTPQQQPDVYAGIEDFFDPTRFFNQSDEIT